MKDAKTFLEALKTDPRAKELMNAAEIPADPEKTADCYVTLAGELGYTLTKEEILAAAQEMSKAQQQKTARAMDKIALENADLDKVAGGDAGNPACGSTYTDGEWCWFSDSCSVVIDYYIEGTPSLEPNAPNIPDLPISEHEFNFDDIMNGSHCTQVPELPHDMLYECNNGAIPIDLDGNYIGGN